jgi:hypothetical protein
MNVLINSAVLIVVNVLRSLMFVSQPGLLVQSSVSEKSVGWPTPVRQKKHRVFTLHKATWTLL